MIRAAQGDIVKVRYTGRLADGTVFDASPEERPLHFIIGKGEVIPGFEDAVAGMYQGETRNVTVPAEKAYGSRDPEKIEEIDRSLLPGDVSLVIGGQLEITLAGGEVLRALVVDLRDDQVTLDRNHPLAGKDLNFEITLLEVDKQPPHSPGKS